MRLPIMLMGLCSIAVSAAAQIDYRNLDHGRPSAVEDAYPVERYGFDVSGGYSGRGLGTNRAVHLFTPELIYGVATGAHLGLALPWVVATPKGAGSPGLNGLDLSLLMNLSTETVRFPGLAIRVDGSLPVGEEAGAGAGLALRVLATRSFGRQRVHLNAAVALASPRDPGRRDEASGWWMGVAGDRTFIRTSTLLIGEATIARGKSGAPLEGSLGFGARRQVAPTLVFDLGLRAEFGPDHATDMSVTLGLSHAFGIGALMAGGAR